jgi:hypothetical protein
LDHPRVFLGEVSASEMMVSAKDLKSAWALLAFLSSPQILISYVSNSLPSREIECYLRSRLIVANNLVFVCNPPQVFIARTKKPGIEMVFLGFGSKHWHFVDG